MNRILEVNEDSMYAVVECGVTTGQLKTYLEENHPDLWFTCPHAPPSVGVVSNAIIHGAGQVSLKYGISSEMINGLEVVLPTGEVLRTGSGSFSRLVRDNRNHNQGVNPALAQAQGEGHTLLQDRPGGRSC
ncbi:MAG: FAD-binding oxidoreductase [Candidatus Freyarchaeota archaeon]